VKTTKDNSCLPRKDYVDYLYDIVTGSAGSQKTEARVVVARFVLANRCPAWFENAIMSI
jgi:hypothetical protein